MSLLIHRTQLYAYCLLSIALTACAVEKPPVYHGKSDGTEPEEEQAQESNAEAASATSTQASTPLPPTASRDAIVSNNEATGKATSGPAAKTESDSKTAGSASMPAPAPAPSAVPQVPNTGLLMNFAFEDSVKDRATSTAGTLTGGTYGAGKFQKALQLNAADQLKVPALAAYTYGAFTIAAWVQVNTAGYGQVFEACNATSAVRLSIRADGALELSYKDTVSTTMIASTKMITAKSWQHVAASYDAKDLRLYLNGAMVATLPLAALMVTAAEHRIGGVSGCGGPPSTWTGSIDELRLYDQALSAANMDLLVRGRP